jgi:hypothetical protein
MKAMKEDSALENITTEEMLRSKISVRMAGRMVPTTTDLLFFL